MIEFYACIFTEENMYDIKKHKNNLAAFIFFNTTLICIVKLYLKKPYEYTGIVQDIIKLKTALLHDIFQILLQRL